MPIKPGKFIGVNQNTQTKQTPNISQFANGTFSTDKNFRKEWAKANKQWLKDKNFDVDYNDDGSFSNKDLEATFRASKIKDFFTGIKTDVARNAFPKDFASQISVYNRYNGDAYKYTLDVDPDFSQRAKEKNELFVNKALGRTPMQDNTQVPFASPYEGSTGEGMPTTMQSAFGDERQYIINSPESNRQIVQNNEDRNRRYEEYQKQRRQRAEEEVAKIPFAQIKNGEYTPTDEYQQAAIAKRVAEESKKIKKDIDESGASFWSRLARSLMLLESPAPDPTIQSDYLKGWDEKERIKKEIYGDKGNANEKLFEPFTSQAAQQDFIILNTPTVTKDTPLENLTLDQFVSIIENDDSGILCSVSDLIGTKYVPRDEWRKIAEELYNENRNLIKAGYLSRAKNHIDRALKVIADENQGFCESAGIMGRQFLGGVIEGALDIAALPLSFVWTKYQTFGNLIFRGEDTNVWGNFLNSPFNKWNHALSELIQGDKQVYGYDFDSSVSASGYSFGMMASMLIPASVIGWAAKAGRITSTTVKMLNTASLVINGLGEGIADAYSVRDDLMRTFDREKGQIIQKYMDGVTADTPYNQEDASKHIKESLPEMTNVQQQYEALALQQIEQNGYFSLEIPLPGGAVDEDGNPINTKTVVGDKSALDELRNTIQQIYYENAIRRAQAEFAFNHDMPNYDKEALHNANTAAGRTMMYEAAVVTVPSLFGLGAEANIMKRKLGNAVKFNLMESLQKKATMNWQKELLATATAKKGWASIPQKALVYTGKTIERSAKTMIPEIKEEVLQGLTSGISTGIAENNMDAYVNSMYYGLGNDYISTMHEGIVGGMFHHISDAWYDMDPEAVIKQTAMSTLLFGGATMPGVGKKMSEIKASNDNKIGMLFDYIRKFSPVHTNLGNAIADTKSLMTDLPNAIEAGLEYIYNDPQTAGLMQTQAAMITYGDALTRAMVKNESQAQIDRLTAAYRAAEGVMLAQAATHGRPGVSERYVGVYRQWANLNDKNVVSPEERQKLINDFRSELKDDVMESKTDDELAEVMQKAGADMIDMYDKAKVIYDKYDGKRTSPTQDIRPLVFNELIQSLMPKTIDENHKKIAERFKTWDKQDLISKIVTANKDINTDLINDIINDYVLQDDYSKRVKFLTKENKEKLAEKYGLKKSDVDEHIKAVAEGIDIGSNDNLKTTDAIEGDVVFANWKNQLNQEFMEYYTRLKAGEGTLSKKATKQLNAITERYSKLGLNMTMRTYADRLNATLGHAGQTAKILAEAQRELGNKKYEEFVNKITQGFRLQGLEGNDTFLDAVKINDAAEQMKSIMGELCDSFANKSNMMMEVERLIDNRVENATSYDKFLNLDNFNTGNPIVNAMFRTAIMAIKDGAQSEVPSSTTNTDNEKSVGTTQPKENVLENTPKQPEKTDGNIINENIDRIINAGHTTENIVEAIATLGKASDLTDVDEGKEKALHDYIISYFDSTENFIVSFSNEFANGTMSFDDYKNNINDLFTELFNIQRSVLDFFSEGDDIYNKSSALYNFIEEQKRKVNNWQAQNEATTEEYKKENTEEKKPKERKITARMKESSARKIAERLAKEIQKQKGSNKSWDETINSLVEKFWDKSNTTYQPLKDLFVDRELFETFLRYSNPDNIEQKLNDLFSNINFESEEEQIRNTKKRSKSFEEFKTEIEDTEEFELLQDLRGTLKKVIIYDNTGDLKDLNRKYIIHPKTRGNQLERSKELNELRSTRKLNGKELISFDNLLERLKKTVAAHRGIDVSYLDINDIRGAVIDLIDEGKTTAQYIREKYNEYIENEVQLDIQRTDEYDRMVRTGLIDELNQLYAEEDAFRQQYEGVELPDDFWITEEKKKEEKTLYEVHVSFPNSSTIYTYYTENPNVKQDMKFTVTTSTGNKRQITVRSVSEANRNELQWNESERSFSKDGISFFMLEDRVEKSEAQQRQEVKHDVENISAKKRVKETSIIQSQMDRANAQKQHIQESHEMPINVLRDSGAHDFLDKGGLHPNDKLGFVIGLWFDHGRPRRVIYVVTEQTYENGSNNIELFGQKNFFGGHQVVDVLDTDSWTENSHVQIINKAAEDRKLGEYFTIENNPLVVTEVNNRGILSSNVKESNEEIQERQLNNILDVDESGNYGRMYEGKMKPVVIVKFQNGSAMASDASFDTGKFVQSKQYETTSSGDFINNASVIVIDSPSGPSSTLVYNRTRKESGKPDAEFDGIISNAIRSGKIGEIVKKMVVDHVDAIGRNQKHSFSLGKIFKLKSGGISISLNKATKTIDISYANIADNKFNVIANISPFNSDGTERSFDDITNDVYNALISYLLDNNIIDGSNIGITKDSNVYEEYPELLNAQISDGLLYCPKAELDSNGKMCLESTTYIAKFEKGPKSERATKRSKEQKPQITPKTIETTPEIAEKPDKTIDVPNSSADDMNVVDWQKSEKGSKYKRNKAKTSKKQSAVESMQQEMFDEVKAEHPNDSDIDNQQRTNCE